MHRGVNGTTLTFSGQLVATQSLPPLIRSLVIKSNRVTLTVTNTTAQSTLLTSLDFKNWSTAAATVTNVAGTTTFTVPVTSPQQFFRVLK